MHGAAMDALHDLPLLPVAYGERWRRTAIWLANALLVLHAETCKSRAVMDDAGAT